MKKKLSQKIKDLSGRARNRLDDLQKWYGISTPEQVIEFGVVRMLKMRNFGLKTIKEIDNKLKEQYGTGLKVERWMIQGGYAGGVSKSIADKYYPEIVPCSPRAASLAMPF